MTKVISTFTIFLLSGLSILAQSSAQPQERITITTYYPSPNGSYREMSVTNRQAVGDVNGDGQIDSRDMAVDSLGNPEPGSLTVAGNVGIGTVNPQDKLEVAASNDPVRIGESGGKGAITLGGVTRTSWPPDIQYKSESAGGRRSWIVSCDAGYRIIGGGQNSDDLDEDAPYGSYPTPAGDGWHCVNYDPRNAVCYAICIR